MKNIKKPIQDLKKQDLKKNKECFKRAITLIELLIVMALLALIASAGMISISRSVVDQQFKTEVALITERLNFAQDLMVILDTDVKAIFSVAKDGKAVEFWIETERKLPVEIKKEFIEKKQILKVIKGVFFRDKRDDTYTKNSTEIKFYSDGMSISYGTIRFSSSDEQKPPENTLNAFLPLVGYPTPIISFDQEDKANEWFLKNRDDHFFEQVVEDTISNLPDVKKEEEDRKRNPKKISFRDA